MNTQRQLDQLAIVSHLIGNNAELIVNQLTLRYDCRMVLLDGFDADVLYHLWKHKEGGNGSYFRAKEIRDELDPKRSGNPSRTKVVRCLDKMKEADLLEWGRVADVSKTTGPAAGGFRIASGRIITRPSSAVMVFEIHRDPSPPTYQSALIRMILAMGLRRKGVALTEADILEQIDFCVIQRYIDRQPSADGQDQLVSKAERIDFELQYLDKLRRNQELLRILLPAVGKEAFDGREQKALDGFMDEVHSLKADQFNGWLSHVNAMFVPSPSDVPADVHFKAGDMGGILEKLRATLKGFSS